jgi:hypothetical protein
MCEQNGGKPGCAMKVMVRKPYGSTDNQPDPCVNGLSSSIYVKTRKMVNYA